MNLDTDAQNLFPEGLSDEAAAALSAFLHELSAACESRYFTQLRRYYERHRALCDPDRPWDRNTPSSIRRPPRRPDDDF